MSWRGGSNPSASANMENNKETITHCLQCGKELNKNQKKFCSRSCAATYNNLHRDKLIYEKIKNTLKNKTALQKKDKNSKKIKNTLITNKRKKKIRYCLYCNKELTTKQNIFCCIDCASLYQSKLKYQHFLDNPDNYCYSTYNPRKYIREHILQEQNYKCDICGCEQIHNNKPLVFILDHIDGNAANNYRNNLRMICPNCDSQLPTYKSKNKSSARRDYFREHIKNKTIDDIKTGKIMIED